MCFVVEPEKYGTESIPSLVKSSPRPPGALSTVGPFFKTSNFYFSLGGPIVRGGGPKIKEGATLSRNNRGRFCEQGPN